MPEPHYHYGRRPVWPSGRILYSVHAANGYEIERFEAYPEEAAVTFAEAGLVPIIPAHLVRLPAAPMA